MDCCQESLELRDRDILTLCVIVAQCRLTHVSELDGTLRARVHELIAMIGVEFGGSDDFCQFFHVHWFDIDNV